MSDASLLFWIMRQPPENLALKIEQLQKDKANTIKELELISKKLHNRSQYDLQVELGYVIERLENA